LGALVVLGQQGQVAQVVEVGYLLVVVALGFLAQVVLEEQAEVAQVVAEVAEVLMVARLMEVLMEVELDLTIVGQQGQVAQ
jgi:hypothetical protein